MLISNNNYARNCDFVFAETVDYQTFESLNKDSLDIIYKNAHEITYKSKILNISDGDTIYCKTDYLRELFYLIKKTKVKNLNLVTHQSDVSISSNSLNKLPENFSNWFTINKNLSSNKVISIPIGLAGNFSKKNLHAKDFNENRVPSFDLKNKEQKIYINFNKNTNSYERNKALNILKNYHNAFISDANLTKDKYKEDLSKYAFVLCPWGNGFDTHRIWETLYSGSIPITKDHYSFEYLEKLPVIIIKDYEDLYNLDLKNYIEKFNVDSFNLKKLYLNYWISKINENKTHIHDRKENNIIISRNVSIYFKTLIYSKNKFESYKKKILYYLKKAVFKATNLYRN